MYSTVSTNVSMRHMILETLVLAVFGIVQSGFKGFIT